MQGAAEVETKGELKAVVKVAWKVSETEILLETPVVAYLAHEWVT